MKKHPYLYSCLVLLILWGMVHLALKKSFVPSPIDTTIYFFRQLPVISEHLLVSLLRIFTAMGITVVSGGAVGIFTARNPHIDRWLSPLLYTLYPIPKIAFLPLLMLFLGLGNASKITLVSLILFFQIVVSIRDSVKSIHSSYLLSIKSLGANKWQTYRHVLIPAILPNLFTALRISVGTSISVLFFAENYATEYGIGYYIMDSWLKLDYKAMFAGIIAISLLGSALFLLLDHAEKAICKWNR